MRSRPVLAAVVAAAWAGLAAPAQADVLTDPIVVEGCYGAGSAIICDATVQQTIVHDPALQHVPIYLCTGTCDWYYVPIVWAPIFLNGDVCVRWTWYDGGTGGTCS